MNIKNLTFFLALTLTNALTSNAQISRIDDSQDVMNLKNVIDQNPKRTSSSSILDKPNLQGSPYWNEDFQSGKIINKESNKEIRNIRLRYRILDDVIQLKDNNSDDFMILDRSQNLIIYINRQKFVFLENYPININGTNNGYSIELFNSKKASLLKRISQNYVEGREADNSYSASVPPKLEKKINYFVKTKEDKISAIEPHKKKAADAFPDHQDEIKSFIKKNKLKFRGSDEEADLITLVEYYSTL
ncbi:hypothetical protein SAMN04488096_105295 [Mesonia phycicola]|uniref:Uncharacterized protein n=1 Tax=Mesonia phycicola TaxID=579105 RepID=A0A1M6EW29_9FLAO|nr:hypothetical protein [Mesonia phycicola]SHI89714.1 hypothetical protein SAMN04488096_105295 [Mesonia phycicola]